MTYTQHNKRLVVRIFSPTVLFIFLSLVYSNCAFSEPYQSLNSINSAVKNYLEEQTNSALKHKISISRIDNRLRLTACDATLHVFFLPGSKNTGSTTVGVRCSSPKKWTLYVPANVKTYGQVAVSRHPLSRGDYIDLDNIQFVEKEISRLNKAYFTESKHVVGKITRRAMAAGQLFTPTSLKPENIVLRGEDVAIMLNSNGFKIRVTGEALMDGSIKQKIKVKNKASKRILEAIVTGRGVVSVRM